METNRGQAGANGQSPRLTFGNSKITPLSTYVGELAYVYRESQTTTDEHVARLAAALLARAPVELARLLEVRA
jgi:hypothetical protein